MKSRVLHPSFFTDEKVRQLSPNAKVLLLGLWLRADDYGRAIYLPKLIEGEVFPTEQVDIYGLLNEIIGLGFIRPYEVAGQMYYDVPNWFVWQKPKYKADSKLPEFPGQVGDNPGKSGDNLGTSQGQNGQEPSDVSVFGSVSELESVFEGVTPPTRDNLRQFWQRRREQQRMEVDPA